MQFRSLFTVVITLSVSLAILLLGFSFICSDHEEYWEPHVNPESQKRDLQIYVDRLQQDAHRWTAINATTFILAGSNDNWLTLPVQALPSLHNANLAICKAKNSSVMNKSCLDDWIFMGWQDSASLSCYEELKNPIFVHSKR